MGNLVKPPPHGWGFSLAHRKVGDIRIYHPTLICAVFAPGKKLSYDFIAIAYKPRPRLVFLGKSSALALLPVPPGDDLPAGGLYEPAFFSMLDNFIRIDRLALRIH